MEPKVVLENCIFYVDEVIRAPPCFLHKGSSVLELLAVPKEERYRLEEFQMEEGSAIKALDFVSGLCRLHGSEARHEDKLIVNGIIESRKKLLAQLEAVTKKYKFFEKYPLVSYRVESGKYTAGQILTKLPKGFVQIGKI